MSGTPSKMSQSVLDLLKQVRSEGSVGLFLQELERDELGFDWIPDPQEMDGSSGTMADSAKRRLLSEVEETPAPRQMPVSTVKSSRQREESLPAGVKDLADWERTLIELGKYAKANLSYMELVSSSEKEKMAYVQWLIRQSSRSDLTPLIRDLVDFLVMFERTRTSAGPSYPGSSVPRKYKD